MAYEILYWPGFTGRAEPAILLLEDVGADYTINTDVAGTLDRVSKEQPVFACPLLIDGDTIVSQTSVIVEYLARKHDCDVAPDDTIKAGQFGYNLADIWRETYESRRDGVDSYLEERFPKWLDVMENSFQGEKKWFFSDEKPTWIDYLALNIVTLSTYCWGKPAKEMMDSRLKLAQWTERAMARPRLKAYFENHESLPVGYEDILASN